MKENCKYCAGVDKENIPINCIICRSNPKYIDRREEYLRKNNEQ